MHSTVASRDGLSPDLPMRQIEGDACLPLRGQHTQVSGNRPETPCFPFNCRHEHAGGHQSGDSVCARPHRRQTGAPGGKGFARLRQTITLLLQGITPPLPVPDPITYYSSQLDARAAIPDHPYIFTRWVRASEQVRRGSAALLDLAYGEADGERLDFFPARQGGGPLLVFIHGGWWRSLDKSDFSFIAPGWLRAGFNLALTNYTLAPEASIEDMVAQQQRALAWLYRRAEQYDFDAGRICIAGHSAGAHLAAMMLATDWRTVGPGLPPDLLKAGVLLSGLYDLQPVLHAPFVNDDLRLTPERAEALSPALLPGPATPFVTAVGGLESEEFKRQTALLGSRWSAGHQADLPLPAANHLTICDAFATPGEALHQAGVDFLARAGR